MRTSMAQTLVRHSTSLPLSGTTGLARRRSIKFDFCAHFWAILLACGFSAFCRTTGAGDDYFFFLKRASGGSSTLFVCLLKCGNRPFSLFPSKETGLIIQRGTESDTFVLTTGPLHPPGTFACRQCDFILIVTIEAAPRSAGQTSSRQEKKGALAGCDY